jgi:hypothetical protein
VVRYLKAALVGLLGGCVVVIAVATIAFVRLAWLTTCVEFQCYGDVQIADRNLGIAFAVGFAAAFAWFLRRQRRLLA